MELQELVERINQWKTSQGAPPIAPVSAPAEIPEIAMAPPEKVAESDPVEIEAAVENSDIEDADEIVDESDSIEDADDSVIDSVDESDEFVEDAASADEAEELSDTTQDIDELEVIEDDEI